MNRLQAKKDNHVKKYTRTPSNTQSARKHSHILLVLKGVLMHFQRSKGFLHAPSARRYARRYSLRSQHPMTFLHTSSGQRFSYTLLAPGVPFAPSTRRLYSHSSCLTTFLRIPSMRRRFCALVALKSPKKIHQYIKVFEKPS